MKIAYIFIFLTKLNQSYSKLNGEGRICGKPSGNSVAEEKIVGGYDVGYYKYPWYAALMVSNIVACGGSLVSTKAVVSAAHCYKEYVVGHDASKKLEDVYNVSLGIYNRCVKEKTQKSFLVEKVYVHEKYKDNVPYFDISLLILKESASAFQPICLPKTVVKKRPREGSVPGLGTLRYHGSTPCTVHEARLLLYSDWECKKMLNRTGNDPKKLYKAFCAGYIQGGIDTCQGDSGGPFQVVDDFGNHILLGLVSFGFHCANPNLLGIYTDVSQYIDWIEEKGKFSANIEETNSTELPVTVQETVVNTENTHKTTKKIPPPAHPPPPSPPHIYHQPVGRPIHIIIYKNEDKKFKTIRIKKQNRQMRQKSFRKKT